MWVFDPGSGVFIGYFLRLIAVAYLFGGLVHLGNLLGFGDAMVVALDAWQRTHWGVACFFLASTSQLVLYLGFPTQFVTTAEDLANIRGLVGFHLVTLAAYATLRLSKW